MANPEQHHNQTERTAEIERAAAERAAELRELQPDNKEQLEQQAELAQEARVEAEKQALPTEHLRQEEAEAKQNTAVLAAAKSPDKAFKETMDVIQRQMSAPARTFSKIIHAKTVEEVSDWAGNTIARPNAVLSGSICAFVLVLALYVHAKYVGYALSGFETIGAFVVGWIIGLGFDFIRTMFRKR